MTPPHNDSLKWIITLGNFRVETSNPPSFFTHDKIILIRQAITFPPKHQMFLILFPFKPFMGVKDKSIEKLWKGKAVWAPLCPSTVFSFERTVQRVLSPSL